MASFQKASKQPWYVVVMQVREVTHRKGTQAQLAIGPRAAGPGRSSRGAAGLLQETSSAAWAMAGPVALAPLTITWTTKGFDQLLVLGPTLCSGLTSRQNLLPEMQGLWVSTPSRSLPKDV